MTHFLLAFSEMFDKHLKFIIFLGINAINELKVVFWMIFKASTFRSRLSSLWTYPNKSRKHMIEIKRRRKETLLWVWISVIRYGLNTINFITNTVGQAIQMSWWTFHVVVSTFSLCASHSQNAVHSHSKNP